MSFREKTAPWEQWWNWRKTLWQGSGQMTIVYRIVLGPWVLWAFVLLRQQRHVEDTCVIWSFLQPGLEGTSCLPVENFSHIARKQNKAWLFITDYYFMKAFPYAISFLVNNCLFFWLGHSFVFLILHIGSRSVWSNSLSFVVQNRLRLHKIIHHGLCKKDWGKKDCGCRLMQLISVSSSVLTTIWDIVPVDSVCYFPSNHRSWKSLW